MFVFSRLATTMSLCVGLLFSLMLHAEDFSSDFSSVSQNAEFLPVEQAYRLELEFSSASVDSLDFIFLLEEGYFLYEHGFHLKWHQGVEEFERKVEQLEIPGGEEKDDEYFGRVKVFYQQVAFTEALDVDVNTPIFLEAVSQGCADAGLCYPPYSMFFRVDLLQQSLERIDAPSYRSALSPSGTAAEGTIDAPQTKRLDSLASLLWVLLSAFIGGLILNLMPCVLPVLTIKVMQLTRQNDVKGHRQQGLAYMLGVVLSFLLIAALMLSIRASGHAVGWGFQLQNPLFVAALVYLFFILALAMAGLVNVGQRFMGAGQSLTQRDGLQGAFFTGVLAVVVASPCTAPFMGGALGYAVTEPAYIGLLIFAFLGLGLALPMTLISFVPAASRLLPKPGLWMERLKQFFAFPLLITAVWLLWVLGNQTSPTAMALILLGCAAIAFALWSVKSPKAVSKVMALIALLLALMLPFSSSFQLQSHERANPDHLIFTRAALDELRQQGAPVFVDLTADWCITCLANEQSTLNTLEVQDAFAEAGIAYMVGDWTHPNPEISALLDEYHRSGIPLYLLYPAEVNARAMILPQILNKAIVLDAIKSVK